MFVPRLPQVAFRWPGRRLKRAESGGLLRRSSSTCKTTHLWRTAESGVTCCTNHFRSEKLCIDDKCWRYTKLAPLLAKDAAKLDVDSVFKELDKVSQKKHTLQSMVFEPADRVLHLAYGEGPATKLKPHRLDLGKLLDDK